MKESQGDFFDYGSRLHGREMVRPVVSWKQQLAASGRAKYDAPAASSTQRSTSWPSTFAIGSRVGVGRHERNDELTNNQVSLVTAGSIQVNKSP